MTLQVLEEVIGRATLDAAFRAALFADPGAALAGYALTADEEAALRAIDVESLESFAASPGIAMAKLALNPRRLADSSVDQS